MKKRYRRSFSAYMTKETYTSQFIRAGTAPLRSILTERQLVDGKCPDCERPVEMMSEELLLRHVEISRSFVKAY